MRLYSAGPKKNFTTIVHTIKVLTKSILRRTTETQLPDHGERYYVSLSIFSDQLLYFAKMRICILSQFFEQIVSSQAMALPLLQKLLLCIFQYSGIFPLLKSKLSNCSTYFDFPRIQKLRFAQMGLKDNPLCLRAIIAVCPRPKR